MIRVLQINSNRARGAFDLMTHTADRLNIDIIAATEPNTKKLGKEWLVDEDKAAAIKLTKEGIPLNKGTGKGFAWIEHKNIVIYSCYTSPNSSILEYQNFLDALDKSIREHRVGQGIVITGDFNSASTIWGSTRTNTRGKQLEEWVSKANLTILNTGNRPTFERRGQIAHIDLTITNDVMIGKTKNWMVLSDLETLSDHKYIVFEVITNDKNRGSAHNTTNKETPT